MAIETRLRVRVEAELVVRESDARALVLWSVETPSGRILGSGVHDPELDEEA